MTPLIVFYWLMFILVSMFGVLNLIIGLFCENTMKVALKTERDIMLSQEDARREKIEKLKQAFMKMDEDGSDLEPVDLFPIVCDLLKSQDLEISYDQYVGCFSCFDRERSGMISQASFLDFARYVAVMARLIACQEAAEARMPSQGGGDESTLEAAEVEEPPCEEDIQRRLDAARAQLEEALRETATQDDIDEARLRVQMDEERLQRARQEFEDLRSKVKAEEETTGRPSRVSSNPSNGEVKHYEEDQQGAATQRKKGCFPACGRK